MKKDFNTRYKKAEYEIVLNHLYVGGWGKPVADLYNMIIEEILRFRDLCAMFYIHKSTT